MNESNLTLANRKQIADLLKQYGSLHEQAVDKYRSKYRELEQSALHEFAEGKLGAQFVSELAAAIEEVGGFEDSLASIGLERDDTTLSIGWNAPGTLKASINSKIERNIGSRRDIDARFDSARIAMMTVPTLEDAKKIIDSLSELAK
jgi:hypothetical protein